MAVELQIEISGPDAFEFTNLLVPRDLSKCDVGQCKYLFITSEDGGILNDPVLLRLEENRFWLSAGIRRRLRSAARRRDARGTHSPPR